MISRIPDCDKKWDYPVHLENAEPIESEHPVRTVERPLDRSLDRNYRSRTRLNSRSNSWPTLRDPSQRPDPIGVRPGTGPTCHSSQYCTPERQLRPPQSRYLHLRDSLAASLCFQCKLMACTSCSVYLHCNPCEIEGCGSPAKKWPEPHEVDSSG